jgi:hypothetical protein
MLESLNRKIFMWIFCISILLFSVCSHYLNSTTAQSISWKKYSDPGKKFSFLYPTSWSVKSTHDNVTGTIEVVLENPNSNSSRLKVSVLYNPNEELLKSQTGKPVIPPKALTNMEKEMNSDYIFFNSTGQFRHKYSIKDYPSASDVIDYEKSKGKLGKMLIVFAKINDKDSLTFTYSESKRLFYKNLFNISQIVKSIAILQGDWQ